MIDCAERDRLLAQKTAAWRDYYDLQDDPAKNKPLKSAEQRVRHAMRAVEAHYRKHGCNKTAEDSK